jgi:putative transposase
MCEFKSDWSFIMINTREIAASYRLEHWAGIVRERSESGLTVKAFCESEGLHSNTYFYWQRRLREAACGGGTGASALPTPTGWTAAVPAESGAPAARALTVEIGKCRVLVGTDADERFLAKVCRVLVSL